MKSLRRKTARAGLGVSILVSFTAAAGFAGCEATSERSSRGDDTGGTGGNGDGGDNTFLDGGFGGGGLCVGLQCQQVMCGGGATTAVAGTVFAPTPPEYGKADPIYNAVVYVPNGAVMPFPPGVACDNCGAPASGKPLVVTLSDAKGAFTLTDVPVGTNIPLVIQIGRWRRQVVIPEVKACVKTDLSPELTRLPRNKAEGDIPHIAVASSPYDAEECILRKIGIDDAEFTDFQQDGRVHIFHGNGATVPKAEEMAALWSDLTFLKKYDMVLFPCSSVAPMSDPTAYQTIFDYANAGGRVFATDLSYPWFKSGPAPFPSTAQWIDWTGTGVDPLPSFVDQSFPKGAAMAQWLQNIGATSVLGNIELNETYHVVDAVNAPTTRWLYSTSPATVQTLSFNTPVGVAPDAQCGRAVYSNFHIANGYTNDGTPFPSECDANPLTPQEKVLEFLLFDLASCVQNDQEEPLPPPK